MRRALIAHLSDLHVVAAGELVWGGFDTATHVRAAVETVLSLSPAPDLVLVSGDLTDNAAPAAVAHVAGLLAPLDGRVVVLPGNHDDTDSIVTTLPPGWLAGIATPDGVVELADGRLRLVCLDSTDPPGPGGTLRPDQLVWLDATLSASPAATIVALHHPPFAVGIDFMDEIPLDRTASAELELIVSRHPQVALVTGGHVHRAIVTRFGGTVAALAPSVANAVNLDLRPGAPPAWTPEPPAFLLHEWVEGRGLVTHLRHVGDYRVTAF